jgi:hypothetical protein
MIQASPTSQWIVFATPLMVALLTIANLVIAKLASNKVDVVAAKAQTVANVAAQVASVAQQQSDKILVLADKTHTLVNSQYGIALALIVEKAQRIYEISRLETDKIELERAKEKLAEHEAKQHAVDSKEPQAAEKCCTREEKGR